MRRLKKPIVLITLPAIVGVIFPSFLIIKPEEIRNIKYVTINGS